MYNTLVERCFRTCVSTFKSRDLEKKEVECVDKCAAKFMSHARRVGQRFAEVQYQQTQTKP